MRIYAIINIVFFALLNNIFLYDCYAKEKNATECKQLREFCPSCDYSYMMELINEWKYPDSLYEYIEEFSDIREDVEYILEDNGVSKYYIYLALAESGGNTESVSPKEAKGLWQLMPYISKHYGLEVSEEKDDRLDYKKSTLAASLYIKRNLNNFDGNALWAIAAYNAGGSNLKNKTSYRCGDDLSKVRELSYRSYALAVTVIKMIYEAECNYENKK